MKSRKRNVKKLIVSKRQKNTLLFVMFFLFSFVFFNFIIFAFDTSNIFLSNIIVPSVEQTMGPGGLVIPILETSETNLTTEPQIIITNANVNNKNINNENSAVIVESSSVSNKVDKSAMSNSINANVDSSIVATANALATEIYNKYGQIYEHDGVYYMKGESYGNFSLTGFCACKICGSGTGYTASGKKVRENHTVAADWNLLPKNTMIILENAVGKDGTVYDGVYQVEDKGGGVKNKHIDIYRPTHELAALVTHYGKAYGDVYIAVPLSIASISQLSNSLNVN